MGIIPLIRNYCGFSSCAFIVGSSRKAFTSGFSSSALKLRFSSMKFKFGISGSACTFVVIELSCKDVICVSCLFSICTVDWFDVFGVSWCVRSEDSIAINVTCKMVGKGGSLCYTVEDPLNYVVTC